MQPETGNLDYGWRQYDAAAVRWTGIDPLAEENYENNPFMYCFNNPLVFVDPDGMLADTVNANSDGKIPNWHNFNPQEDVVQLGEATVKPESSGIGQPGTLESFIPVWGSGRAAVDDFQNGRWGWGIFNTAVAVSDAFTLGGASAIGKGIVKGGILMGGNFAWRSSRRRIVRFYQNAFDITLVKHQPIHHWFFQQNKGIGKNVAEAIKNQPWNVHILPVEALQKAGLQNTKAGWNTLHMAVEGRLPAGHAASLTTFEQFKFGTPQAFQNMVYGVPGVVGDVINTNR